MTVAEAKEIARDWVGQSTDRPALFHGSVREAEGILPPHSDVDVLLVQSDSAPGKFRYRGVLLECSAVSPDRLATPEAVLGDYHLAPSFASAQIIQDPDGRLAALSNAVAPEFAQPEWVARRCDHAEGHARRVLAGVAEGPLPDRVTRWLFANGIAAHVLLVAGLRNPTVRRRYAAVRDLLREHGRLDLYESLLAHLGCASWTPAQTQGHLDRLATVFDATMTWVRPEDPFAADLTPDARPVAIEGSQAMIAAGDPRESVFWIAATWSRLQRVLDRRAPPEVRARSQRGYDELLRDLNATDPSTHVQPLADLLTEVRRHAALLSLRGPSTPPMQNEGR